ncbi:hypothetical protein ISN45_At04g001830 [Arabidopsis thaliana x Arabidopsis arenosa]|nr:hypothetical protein ISN45_At04g001830 [Arabidopsis thaliana x Arabidopsis arenosa]
MMVNGSFGMKLMLIESLNLLKNTTVLEDQGKWNCEFGSKLWLCTRSVKDKITGVAREVTPELQYKTQCDAIRYKWGLATLDGLHSDFDSTENFIGFIELGPDLRNRTVEPDTHPTSLRAGDGSYKVITNASEFHFLPP